MKKSSLIIIILGIYLFSFGLAVSGQHDDHAAHDHEESHHQHAAHVHGEARLMVAADDSLLELRFESPAMNVLGFEHRPETKQQHEMVKVAQAKLKNPGDLFAFPDKAGCSLSQVDVEMPFHEEHNDEHSDINANYQFACKNMAALTKISVHLFEAFPLTEAIDVQSISASGQQAFELTSHNHSFSF